MPWLSFKFSDCPIEPEQFTWGRIVLHHHTSTLSAPRVSRRNRFNLQASRELVFLAPSTTAVPPNFQKVTANAKVHRRLLAEMQRLRGEIYLSDGAIRSEDLVDGRHRAVSDDASWHILVLDAEQRV